MKNVLFLFILLLTFAGCPGCSDDDEDDEKEVDKPEEVAEEVKPESKWFLVKIDSSGKKTWETALSRDIKSLGDMVEIENGAVILVGSIRASQKDDAFIAEYSSSGKKVWSKKHHFDYNDIAVDVDPSGDGGYYVGGTNRIDGESYTSKYTRMYVMKTDSQGEKLWSVSEKINDGFWSTECLTRTSDGGVAVMANKDIAADRCYILKYDSSGNKLWSKNYLFSDFKEMRIRELSTTDLVCFARADTDRVMMLFDSEGEEKAGALLPELPGLEGLTFDVTSDNNLYLSGTLDKDGVLFFKLYRCDLSNTILSETDFVPDNTDISSATMKIRSSGGVIGICRYNTVIEEDGDERGGLTTVVCGFDETGAQSWSTDLGVDRGIRVIVPTSDGGCLLAGEFSEYY